MDSSVYQETSTDFLSLKNLFECTIKVLVFESALNTENLGP